MSADTPALSLPPLIQRRSIDAVVQAQAEREGFTLLQARLLAARVPSAFAANLRAHITPSLQQLDGPETLPDTGIATRLIADAVMDPSQHLLICSDHDVDGLSGNSVLRIALIEHFGVDPSRVGSVLSHKRKEGFGISEMLLERLVEEFPPPALVITVDQGSQDESRFAPMRAMGYRVIVTDHHHIDVPPPSAEATVNPTRDDAQFPDPWISGCHVAWLLACSVRRELKTRGYLPANAPSLACLLDLVAASVTVDAVSIARSVNNRAVLTYGLHLMNTRPRPAWIAMREIMKKEGPFTEQDLAMSVGPRLNAFSRMGEAMPGVEFMLSTDAKAALALAQRADEANQERKAAEKAMTRDALVLAAPQVAAHCHAVTVHLPEGISSIHGITASRLTEAFGRPTMCLSPKHGHPDELTGSLRSIPGINILAALTEAERSDPGCTLSFGGHFGAGGCRLKTANVERLTRAFDRAVGLQRDLSHAVPVVWSDGVLDRAPDAALVAEIAAIGPFGREFEAPLFEADVRVLAVKPMGDGSHLQLELAGADGVRFRAAWFGAVKFGQPIPVTVNTGLHILYALSTSTYRGQRRLDIHIKHADTVQRHTTGAHVAVPAGTARAG